MTKLVVLGNGPSLRGFDFNSLAGASTIGMNAAYRFWRKIDWCPDYYICMDDKVTETHHKQIFEIITEGKIKKFFLTRYILDYYPELKYHSNVYFLEQFNTNYKSIAEKLQINFIDSMFFNSSKPALITTGSQAVRFGCFLGYTDITLLGVDLNYQEVKEGISKEGEIELKVTSKIRNNPNYFFDEYQAVGDKFNIPNPAHLGDLHHEVFRVISKDMKIFNWPVKIFNSNKSSKIYENKTFIFKSLDEFFGKYSNTVTLKTEEVRSHKERVLIIDPTYAGHQSATGQLKLKLFSSWKDHNIAQVCINFDDTNLRFVQGLNNIKSNKFKCFDADKEGLIGAIKEFHPTVIYFRPIDSERLFSLVFELRKRFEFRLATHFMDDWALRFKENRAPLFEAWDKKISSLVRESEVLIAISKKMAQAYSFRYGRDWFVIANGVKADFPGAQPSQSIDKSNFLKAHPESRKFIIRYMGGAAKDMNFQSIIDFAYCVETEFKERVVFEIYTMSWYQEELKDIFKNYTAVNVCDLVPEDRYANLLKSSDALLIAYNFDLKSQRYTSLSMANKMPECLNSGVPVIAYGPNSIATIDFLSRYGLATVVKSRVTKLIAKAINSVIEKQQECYTKTIRAQGFARRELNEESIINKFSTLLCGEILPQKDVINHVPEWDPSGEIIAIEKTLLEEEINFPTSNRCISQGLYLKALIILSRLNYAVDSSLARAVNFNKFYCLKKLGFYHTDPNVLTCRFI